MSYQDNTLKEFVQVTTFHLLSIQIKRKYVGTGYKHIMILVILIQNLASLDFKYNMQIIQKDIFSGVE